MLELQDTGLLDNKGALLEILSKVPTVNLPTEATHYIIELESGEVIREEHKTRAEGTILYKVLTNREVRVTSYKRRRAIKEQVVSMWR